MLGSMGGNYREFETKGKGLSLDTRVSFEGRALAKPHFGEAEGSRAGEEEPALLKVSGAEVVLPCSPLGAFGYDGSLRGHMGGDRRGRRPGEEKRATGCRSWHSSHILALVHMPRL